MSFKPPADAERCRAVVIVAGVRGRCRNTRSRSAAWQHNMDLCWKCFEREQDGKPVPRVQEPEAAR